MYNSVSKYNVTKSSTIEHNASPELVARTQ